MDEDKEVRGEGRWKVKVKKLSCEIVRCRVGEKPDRLSGVSPVGPSSRSYRESEVLGWRHSYGRLIARKEGVQRNSWTGQQIAQS